MNGENPSFPSVSRHPPQFPVKYGCVQKFTGAAAVLFPPLALAAELAAAAVAFPPATLAAAVMFPTAGDAGVFPSPRPASGHAAPTASNPIATGNPSPRAPRRFRTASLLLLVIL
jgi:hypothetical protein